MFHFNWWCQMFRRKTGLTCTVNCNFPLKILCNLLLLVICVWETHPKIKLKQNQYIQITLSLNLSGHCKSHRLFRWSDWVVWTWMLKGSIKEEGPDQKKHIHRNVSLNVNLKTKAYNCSFPLWCSLLKCFKEVLSESRHTYALYALLCHKHFHINHTAVLTFLSPQIKWSEGGCCGENRTQ